MKSYFFPSTRERWSFLHTIEESTLPQTHNPFSPLLLKWVRQRWTYSVPRLFSKPLPGWPLPPRPAPSCLWSELPLSCTWLLMTALIWGSWKPVCVDHGLGRREKCYLSPGGCKGLTSRHAVSFSWPTAVAWGHWPTCISSFSRKF